MKRLVVEVDVLPLSLDTTGLADYAGTAIAPCLCDTLLADADDEEGPRSGLCELVSCDPSATRWRLRVADDAMWSDGQPVLAADVASAIRRAALDKRSPTRRLGAQLARCEASGRNQIELALRRPLAHLPEMLTTPSFSPVASDRRAGARTARHEPAPTIGPYRARGMVAGGRGLVLDAVSGVRLSRSSAPQELLFYRTDSPEEGLGMFEAGTLDITSPTTFPWRRLDAFRSSLNTVGLLLAVDMWFSAQALQRLSFASRAALSAALDRHALAAAIDNVMRPGWRWVDLWNGHESNAPRDAYLQRHRYRDDRTMPSRLTVAFPDFPPNSDILDEIERQWAEAFGLSLVRTPLPYDLYVADAVPTQTDLTLTLWGAAWPDPAGMLSAFCRDGLAGRAYHWNSAEFEREMIAAEALTTRAQRFDGYRRANDILLAQHLVVPLLHATGNYLHQPHLQNVRLRSSGAFELWQVGETGPPG